MVIILFQATTDKSILIAHDRLCSKGGGERVAKALYDMFPNSKIVCSNFEPDKTFEFEPERIINLNTWDDNRKGLHAMAKNVFGTIGALRRFKHNADVLITSGMWAAYTPKHNAKKAVYCHAPSREIYDLKQYFLRTMNWCNQIQFKGYCDFREYLDKKHVKDTDVWITNSQNTQRRIKRYYGYNSTVITPVSTDGFYYAKNSNFWLCVGRYEELKRPDLIINAFKKMPNERLVMVGNSVYGNTSIYKKLTRGCKNITFLESISDDDLKMLYATCKGTIHGAMFEDYGLTTQESFKSGKPAVVFDDSEGFAEQINENNGVVLPEPYEVNLMKTVWNWDSSKYDENTIQNGVKDLTISNFQKNIYSLLLEKGIL